MAVYNNRFAEWDRTNTLLLRYWTIYEETGMTLTTDEAKDKHNERFRREVQFLIRRSCDPDFHSFLNKRLYYTKGSGRKSGLVIRKHTKELARFILLDKLLHSQGKFLTVSDLDQPTTKDKQIIESSSSLDTKVGYHYAHLLQIVNEYYPELLTARAEIKKQTGRKKWRNDRYLENHRERIVETQFSRDEKVPPYIFDLIVARAMRQDATDDFFRRMHMQNGELIKSNMCDPIDLTKLLAFKEDISELIAEIGFNPFRQNPQEQMPETIQDFLTQMLFQQIRLLVELRWFRGKSPEIQHGIIFKEPAITKYHKKEATQAINLNWLWFKDTEKVIKSATIAGISYIKYRSVPQPEVGVWLLQECLKQLPLSQEDKALTFYNIAMMYQQTNQLRLMMQWLKKAQTLWKQLTGHPGDIADTYAYMAEYWRVNGDMEKYMLCRNRAEELLQNDTFLSRQRKAFHFLFLADCSAMFEDRDWEKHLYELGYFLTSKDTTLVDFAKFFKQSLNDLKEFGRRGPQGGPGRCAPPDDFAEAIISSSFKTWIN